MRAAPTRPQRPQRRPAGFTLAELVGVLAVLGAVSISAAPALRWIESSRRTALEREVERMLAHARGFALATGQPAGVVFDIPNQTLALVRIASLGAVPTPMPGPTGPDEPVFAVAGLFPGAEVVSLTNGDGSGTHTGVWFGHAGQPEVRTAAGAVAGAFTGDATITLSGGRTVVVRRLTGLIE